MAPVAPFLWIEPSAQLHFPRGSGSRLSRRHCLRYWLSLLLRPMRIRLGTTCSLPQSSGTTMGTADKGALVRSCAQTRPFRARVRRGDLGGGRLTDVLQDGIRGQVLEPRKVGHLATFPSVVGLASGPHLPFGVRQSAAVALDKCAFSTPGGLYRSSTGSTRASVFWMMSCQMTIVSLGLPLAKPFGRSYSMEFSRVALATWSGAAPVRLCNSPRGLPTTCTGLLRYRCLGRCGMEQDAGIDRFGRLVSTMQQLMMISV